MARPEPWTRQHKPSHPDTVIGQEAVVKRVLSYVQGYKRGHKPLLLGGPTGIGKTSLVHAVATALDRELVEVNASDERGKDAIASVIGQAAFQATLFAKERIILIDEIDGISGTSDRGGIPALLEILPRSSHPVILTANDLEIDKLKPLRKACEVIEVAAPSVTEIAGLLSRIAQIEGLALDADAASGIARRSGGDVRAAVTDLQSVAHDTRVTKAHLDSLDARDTTGEIADGVALVLRTTAAETALPAFDTVDGDPDEILHWMDENLPRAYRAPKDIACAYDALARADIFLGRIRRWQHYRYYVYVYNLLTAGIALAKEGKITGALDPKRPERFLKMWIAKQRNAKRDAIAKAIAPQLHTSAKRARQDIVPYLRAMAKAHGHAWTKEFSARYGLDEEQSAWLSA
jgi:replication factor C large subunit